MSAGKTKKLDVVSQGGPLAVSAMKSIDLGMPRPWRISIHVVDYHVQLIFDLTDALLVGRMHVETGFYPDVDLGAFGASEMGVSREHLHIRLDDDHVVIVDNGSANGTRLNGERLNPHEAYRVRHGDALELGLMKLQVGLLTNDYF